MKATESTVNIVSDDGKETEQPTTSTTKRWLSPGLFTAVFIFGIITAHFAVATVEFYKTDTLLRYTCCHGYGFLLILYVFIVYGYLYAYFIGPHLLKPINRIVWKPLRKLLANIFEKRFMIWILYVAILVAIIIYLVFDAWDEKQRLIPAAGLVVFLIFGFVFSNNRKKINWHIIIRGLILQFVFGLITLRWDTGRNIFECTGKKVTTFLGYAKNGSAFVYGYNLVLNDDTKAFAFEAISTIYFLAFMINILYHLGIMQNIVGNLGNFLQAIMGTSICESVNSAANIFLGQTEAPLLIKPYLNDLTPSELHSIMTGGFASVSGTVLAAYISFGANPAHLITASVMAAPAGLVYSKLMFPQEEEVKVNRDKVALAQSEFSSVLDAASQGASQATFIILGIIANLIAFISTVYFVNGVLSWAGELAGSPYTVWSIELIMGYVFTPISYVMGVPWEECQEVGKLIGLKTMVNEFAAFQQFKTLNLSPRSKIIATFAICGFANPGSIGIMIAGLGTLMPKRSELITKTVFRAFVAGSVVCFTTACIAGMLSPSVSLE